MRVLMITSHYLDDNNGGANAAKGHFYCLASIFKDCSLIYPEHSDRSSSQYVPKSVKLYPCFDNRTKIRKALDVYMGKIHRFPRFVKDHLSVYKYDIIVMDHSRTAAGIIQACKKNGAKIISIHQNVERDYLKDNKPNILVRIPYLYYALKAEKDALSLSDVNLVLTKGDYATFKNKYPNKNLHMHCIGICEYRPLEKIEYTPPKDNIFVISGSLCFNQSVIPIIEFLKDYYHIILQRDTNSQLIIAGRSPSEHFISLSKSYKNVEIIPSPKDMPSVIRKGRYYVCPINMGSGIKLRILDGLKQGLPVLCHEQAAIGYESFVENGIVFTYHDSESFKKSLLDIISYTPSPEKVYTVLQKEFSLQSGIERMNGIFVNEGIL